MYGDTDVLRRRSDRLREQAEDVRTLADQLMAQTEGLGWTGRAAESMRTRVAERATHLRAAAGRHDVAADALDKHVQEVERVAESIEAVERKATRLVTDARSRVAAIQRQADDDPTAPRAEPDPDDVALAAFVPPPSGHRDWLDVELPGL